jgi:glycerate 2-kinase
MRCTGILARCDAPLVLASDKFKNCLSSSEVNEALAQGLTQAARQQSVPLQLERFSVSDGGEGFLAMVAQGRDVQEMPPFSAIGPDGKRVSVPWIKQQNVAFIESAHVIGHACVNTSGNPLAYSSYGLGEVLARVAQYHPDIRAIYVGLGSSAIVDGGMGALAALGARFYNRQGEVLAPHLSALSQLHSLTPPRCVLPPVHWVADVNNPVSGSRSGLRVYGPQKGVLPRQIEYLTAHMDGWWKLLWEKGRCDSRGERLAFNPWLQQRYRGAAGGVGMGVSAFYGGRWHGGSQWCIEHLELSQRLRSAAGLIIGEGCFDRGSLEGKITGTLIGLARDLDKPVIGVFGQIAPEMKQNYLWEKQAYSDSSHAFKPEKEATRQWLMRCGSDLLTAFEYAFEGRNVLKDIEQNQYKQDGQEDL